MCAPVCVHVNVCACLSVYVHILVLMWRSEDNLNWWPSDALRHFFFFLIRSLIGSDFAKEVRLTSLPTSRH